MNEGGVEERIELSINSMVEDTVTNASLMNLSGLRVGDGELIVTLVMILSCLHLVIKEQEIIHETTLKGLNIGLRTLTSAKLPPR